MNELTEMNNTMTVYEIANLVKYGSTHKDAMKICETLIKDNSFREEGDSPPSLIFIKSINNIRIQSYALNKRQSFALASRLNVSFLMKVIDRWQELESNQKQKSIEVQPENMITALKIMGDWLNLPDSGKVTVMKIGMQDYPRFVQALPDYTVDRPIIDNHVASNVIGSSDTTHAMSYHIKDKGFELGIRKVNTLLVEKGILEVQSRKSSKRGYKNFKVLTEKGLEFGKNITSDKNPRESSPHYYDSMIDELFEVLI